MNAKKTTLLDEFTANENLAIDNRAHVAIKEWNKASAPICPGLSRSRSKRKKHDFSVTSDSYCLLPEYSN